VVPPLLHSVMLKSKGTLFWAAQTDAATASVITGGAGVAPAQLEALAEVHHLDAAGPSPLESQLMAQRLAGLRVHGRLP